MNYEVKELQIGGILDHTFRLFKDHFKFLATIVCIVLLPLQVLMSLWTTYAARAVELSAAAGDPDTGLQLVLGIGVLATVPVLLLLNAVTQGAVAYGIAGRFLGNDISAGECIRSALRKLPYMVVVAILYGLGLFVGFLLLFIPAIIFSLMWYLLYPVLMLENAKPIAAFGRSRQLMVGHKSKAFVLGFVLVVIVALGTAMAELLPGIYLSAIAQSVIQSFFVALNAIVCVVVYFSARCHAEQFDLQLMAEMVEGKQEAEPSVL